MTLLSEINEKLIIEMINLGIVIINFINSLIKKI